MTRLLYIAILNLILAALMTAQAFAGDITALVGVTRFTPRVDGTWYQKIYPYELSLTSPSIGLRYDSDHTESGLSYSVGYMHLGRVSSTAVAVGVDAPGDGGYDPSTRTCVGGCMETSHWYGAGSVQGFFGSAVKTVGPWSIEAGAYLYQPRWQVHIPDWRACRECPAIPWRVEHTPRWQVGPMVGLRYKVDDWSINASVWRTSVKGDKWIPVFNLTTFNFAVGYAF